MVVIEEIDAGFRIVDGRKRELLVRTPAWDRNEESLPFPRHVDGSVTGLTSELRFPEAAVTVERMPPSDWTLFLNEARPLHLEPDDYTVKIDAQIVVYLRFRGSGSIAWDEAAAETVIRFPEATSVAVGFRSSVHAPAETITVSPDPAGVATAITHLATGIETTTPDKSFPSLRRHPPAIDLGDRTDIPREVADRRRETGIVFHVPDDLESLFVIAPLAYYLQAAVRAEPRDRARLVAPDVGLSLELPSISQLQFAVAALLRRVFFLDCLVRNAGPYSADLAERSLLDDISLDPDRTYAATPQERLAAYLNAAFDLIEDRLPEWHLTMYVAPRTVHVPTLSRHLDRLSLIFLPESTTLNRDEFVKRSLDGSHRSVAADGGTTTVEPLLPRLHDTQMHGWMADGVPIDAFKALVESYDNRLGYLASDDYAKAIRVVLNDREMEGEQRSVAAIYEQRARELSIDVRIERELDRDSLGAVFREPADFVHYIGHCTDAGLQCPDGYLSVSDLDACRAQTFFLNACGSYYQGVGLVEKGSVAGVVTLEPVLHGQATSVGTTFAQLIVNGFSVERALQLARRQSIMSKGYVTVGDGAHVLTQADEKQPTTLLVTRTGTDRFRVITDTFAPQAAGGMFQSYFPEDEKKHLFGGQVSVEISRAGLLDFLAHANAPVVFEERYFWSDELHASLERTG